MRRVSPPPQERPPLAGIIHNLRERHHRGTDERLLVEFQA